MAGYGGGDDGMLMPIAPGAADLQYAVTIREQDYCIAGGAFKNKYQ